MMLTYYRIVDTTTNETVADHMDNYPLAVETLTLYRLDYPHSEFEIENYIKQTHTIRHGTIDSDPDLYND